MDSVIVDPSSLTDEQLVEATARMATAEREATADLIAHLMEFEARELHLRLGHPSLFAYCCEVLRLSEHETYNRIEVARASRRCPMLLGLLRDGALTLTNIRLLAPVLDEGNRERLLAAAAYRSKRVVEELIAAERPRPPAPDTVRRQPVRLLVAAATTPPARLPQPAKATAPLSPDRFEVRFTASAATCDKLRQARDLLRHAVPGGETAEIVDRALTVLIEQLVKAKFAAGRSERGGRGVSTDARHLSASVKRNVYLRDGGRCAFVGPGGRRCNSRAFLEFHHLKPWAEGGEGTADNVALRCRAHNQLEARLYFGPIREARAKMEDQPMQ